MVNQKLIDYIRKELEKGFSKQNIKKKLLEFGYSKKDVKDSLEQINFEGSGARSIRPRGVVILLSAVVVLVVVLVWIYVLPEKEVPSEKVIVAEEFKNKIFDNGARTLKNQLLSQDSYLMSNLVVCNAVVGSEIECDVLLDNSMKERCKERAYFFGTIRDIANSNCNIKETGIVDIDFCRGINLNCDGLSGDKELLCRSVLDKEVGQCAQIKSETLSFDTETCTDFINFFWAAKSKDSNSCENDAFEISEQEVCKGIINNNCNGVVDKMMRDLTVVDYAKSQKDLSVCEKVSNDKIKVMCYDESMSYSKIYSEI